MARVDVVTHETACTSLVAGRQVLFFAGDHRALFGLETRIAGGAGGTLGLLAVLGDQGVDAGGLGRLTLRRGAAFLAVARRGDGLDVHRGLVTVVLASSKHASRLADSLPASHSHGLPWLYG